MTETQTLPREIKTDVAVQQELQEPKDFNDYFYTQEVFDQKGNKIGDLVLKKDSIKSGVIKDMTAITMNFLPQNFDHSILLGVAPAPLRAEPAMETRNPKFDLKTRQEKTEYEKNLTQQIQEQLLTEQQRRAKAQATVESQSKEKIAVLEEFNSPYPIIAESGEEGNLEFYLKGLRAEQFEYMTKHIEEMSGLNEEEKNLVLLFTLTNIFKQIREFSKLGINHADLYPVNVLIGDKDLQAHIIDLGAAEVDPIYPKTKKKATAEEILRENMNFFNAILATSIPEWKEKHIKTPRILEEIFPEKAEEESYTHEDAFEPEERVDQLLRQKLSSYSGDVDELQKQLAKKYYLAQLQNKIFNRSDRQVLLENEEIEVIAKAIDDMYKTAPTVRMPYTKNDQ